MGAEQVDGLGFRLAGFTDYKHFCSVFKRCTGLTPREYLRGSTAHSGAAADDNQKG